MRKFTTFPLLLLFVFVCVKSAYADVAVVDGNFNSREDSEPFDTGTIDNGGFTNDTEAGDFAVIHCGTENDGQPDNNFFPPTPGDWIEIDRGPCGQDGCAQGVWGMFTDTSNIETITCSWSEPTFVFAAGSFRYRNVDRDNPIIDVACQTGTSDTPTAPSIFVEPGSMVYAFETDSVETGFDCPPLLLAEEEEVEPVFYFACANEEISNVRVSAQTFLSPLGGPTGEISLELGEVVDWRACTVGIRMASGIRPIPTMSEWGFLAVAVFMGAAGVWYLRRRQTA